MTIVLGGAASASIREPAREVSASSPNACSTPFSRAKAGSSAIDASRSTTATARAERVRTRRAQDQPPGVEAELLAVEAGLRADDREPARRRTFAPARAARRCATNGSARAPVPSARTNVHVTSFLPLSRSNEPWWSITPPDCSSSHWLPVSGDLARMRSRWLRVSSSGRCRAISSSHSCSKKPSNQFGSALTPCARRGRRRSPQAPTCQRPLARAPRVRAPQRRPRAAARRRHRA